MLSITVILTWFGLSELKNLYHVVFGDEWLRVSILNNELDTINQFDLLEQM